MTEKQLKKLGFKKESYVCKKPKENFYYYVLDIADVTLLTSQCSDEVKDSRSWSVGFFDSTRFNFKKYKHLKKIINALNKSVCYDK